MPGSPVGGGVVGLGSGIDTPSVWTIARLQIVLAASRAAGQTAWMLIAPLDRAWWIKQPVCCHFRVCFLDNG